MGRLIINNIEIELEPTKPIARTLQVNDIANLQNRQANFSATFSIPRTAKNIKAFANLGIVGANSNIPYQKNNAYYYAESGECLVYNGWAVITSTEKSFKCNLYDGNIDLYKAIENKNLGDLDLSEIDHNKNLTTVLNSFTSNLNYKYIVADYNGKMIYNTNRINIDYLVPSAKVSYLWNKIFNDFGFTFDGSVFSTVDFLDFWLSYPKAPISNTQPIEIFNGETLSVTNEPVMEPLAFTENITIDNILDYEKREFTVPNTGSYQLEINKLGNGTVTYFENTDFGSYILYSAKLPYIYINGIPVISSTQNATQINLIVNDIITVKYYVPDNIVDAQITYSGTFFDQLIIKEYQGEVISFSNELKDFSIKDFINEILNRFALTPFKHKYENHYTFLTVQEILQNNNVEDWSDKFVEQTSEKYIFGSYAQQNKLTYKYNEQEDDYYDSKITINNVNIPDSKIVFGSKVYAPEKEKTNLLHDLFTNVYKMWNKEVKDNGDVNYKGLSKRYYFMRESSHTFTSTTQIGSETLQVHQNITTVPVESFYNLRMDDVVRNYYKNIGSILNYAKVNENKIYLNDIDISNIDFSKLYYINQINRYFILNKINNFTSKGITKTEMINVDYGGIVSSTFAVPKIHLGQGQLTKTAPTNTDIIIHQDTIYKDGFYEVSFTSGGTIISQTLYKTVVRFASAGTYTFNIKVRNINANKEMQSNNLIITIT